MADRDAFDPYKARKSISVNAVREIVWRVFTEKIGTW